MWHLSGMSKMSVPSADTIHCDGAAASLSVSSESSNFSQSEMSKTTACTFSIELRHLEPALKAGAIRTLYLKLKIVSSPFVQHRV